VKKGEVSIKSSLAGVTTSGPTPPDQLDAMHRALWRKKRTLMICPDDIEAQDPWLAQALRNLANKLYGAAS
jgi:hypothetical protein